MKICRRITEICKGDPEGRTDTARWKYIQRKEKRDRSEDCRDHRTGCGSVYPDFHDRTRRIPEAFACGIERTKKDIFQNLPDTVLLQDTGRIEETGSTVICPAGTESAGNEA